MKHATTQVLDFSKEHDTYSATNHIYYNWYSSIQ